MILIIAFLNLWISPYFELNRREEFIKHNTFSQISENNNKNLSIPVATAIVAGRGIISAFTLAELIVTMSIIGVVAVLVIPPLVTNLQDMQLKTAFKENYSLIDQVTKRIASDNGGTLDGIVANYNYGLRDLYKNYLNYIKQCDDNNSVGNCWHDKNNITLLNGQPYSFKAFAIGIFDTPRAGLVLNNGAMLIFDNPFYYAPDHKVYCKISSAWGSNYCAELGIDVNGFKGPNTFGKDIFHILIKENGIAPASVGWCSASPSDVYAGAGQGCADKLLKGISYY